MTEQPDRVDLSTPDLAAANRDALAALFPGVLADGVLDATRLGELLDMPVTAPTDGRERFGLMWAGKQEAVRSLLTPSRGTLVPDMERSVDFDNAKNVFIEGDNLEVLKLLQKAYNDKVKLIYIDPPYNTGNDFVYNDDFSDGLRGYLELTGQIDGQGNRVAAESDLAGRLHSRWLSMMYPRLTLGRNLLTPDGVIFVHIDENEAPRLAMLMEEIFGAENSLGEIVWDKRNPKGDATGISSQHETVLVFARDKEALLSAGGLTAAKSAAEEIIAMASSIWSSVGSVQIPEDLRQALRRHGIDEDLLEAHAKPVTPELARLTFKRWLRDQPFSGGELAYDKIDDDGEVFRLVSMAWPNKKKAPPDYWIPLVHPRTGKPCPVPQRGWRNPPATMQRLMDEGRIVFGEDESTQPQRKYLLRENMSASIASIIPHGGSDDRLLEELQIPFDTPKPIEFIRRLVAATTSGDDIVLDFFAGSGSTAHAVALQNDLDGGRRCTISVNIPEPVEKNSYAHRLGFETVSEITFARLQAVHATTTSGSELGLRALRLGASHFTVYDSSAGELFDLSEQTRLPSAIDEEAVAQEVLLSEGVPLQAEWKRASVGSCSVVAAERVMVVTSGELTADEVQGLLELAPATLVVLEDLFAGKDSAKANAFTRARELGITMKTV